MSSLSVQPIPVASVQSNPLPLNQHSKNDSQAAVSTTTTTDHSSIEKAKTDLTAQAAESNNDKKISKSDAGTGSPSAARSITHMTVSYDQNGQQRTKFMDSNNEVMFQVPTEMVAKMKELMAASKSSVDTIA